MNQIDPDVLKIIIIIIILDLYQMHFKLCSFFNQYITAYIYLFVYRASTLRIHIFTNNINHGGPAKGQLERPVRTGSRPQNPARSVVLHLLPRNRIDKYIYIYIFKPQENAFYYKPFICSSIIRFGGLVHLLHGRHAAQEARRPSVRPQPSGRVHPEGGRMHVPRRDDAARILVLLADCTVARTVRG